MFGSPHLRRVVACAAIFAPLLASAQNNSGSQAGGAMAGNGAAMGTGLKPLNLEDYGKWIRVGGTSISPDGKWMTYTLTPNEGGEASLHIKPIDGGNEIVVGM